MAKGNRARRASARMAAQDLSKAFRDIEVWHQQESDHGEAVYPQGWHAQAGGNTQSGLTRWREWLDKQR